MSLLDRAPWLTLNDNLEQVLDNLQSLLDRPAWQADALCREYPHVNFFPKRGEDVRAARALCNQCLVKDECHAAAAEHERTDPVHGIWGGLTAQERRDRRPKQSGPVIPALDDPAWLRAQYVELARSPREIAVDLGCNHPTVRAALIRHGIPLRDQSQSQVRFPQLHEREWLEHRYLVDGQTVTAIASELGCTGQAVRVALARHGIARSAA